MTVPEHRHLDERAIELVRTQGSHPPFEKTLPEARHRGCWAAMVRSRLAAVPDLPAVALFGDDSRPGAERLFGFLPITRFTMWMLPRPA